jgi:hypothetical protein
MGIRVTACITVGAVAAGLFCGAGPGHGAQSGPGAAPSLAYSLPADTLLFIRFDKSSVDPDLYARSFLSTILRNEEVDVVRSKKRWVLRGEPGDTVTAHTSSIDELLSLFDQESSFAVLDADISEKPPRIRAVMTVRIGEREGKLRQFLEAARHSLASAAPAISWESDDSSDGITLVSWSGRTVAYSFTRGYFLAATGEETLRRMRNALRNPPRTPLAAAPGFVKVLEQVGGWSPLFAYVNAREITAALLRLAPDRTRTILERLAPSIPTAIASATLLDPPGVLSKVFMAVERAGHSDSEAEQVGPEHSVEERSFNVVPERSPACLGVVFDAEILYRKLAEFIASAMPPPPTMPRGKGQPEMPNPLDIATAAASGKIGFDIRKELLPLLKGDLVMYQAPTSGALFPDIVLVVPVSDPPKLEKCLAALPGTLAALTVKTSHYAERRITSLSLRVGEGRWKALSLYYSIAGDRLLISFQPAVLKDALHHITSGSPSITDTEDFKAVTSHLPARKQYLSYQKPGKGLEDLYGLATALVDASSALGFEIIDPLEMPRKGLFDMELTGVAASFVRTDEGFLYEEYSPLGMSTAIEPSQGAAVAGLLSAIAIPNFIRAREAIRKNSCINNIHKFENAKRMYAMQMGLKDGDTFPIDALDDYLPNQTAGAKCPSGGTYSGLNIVGAPVRCSVHGIGP